MIIIGNILLLLAGAGIGYVMGWQAILGFAGYLALSAFLGGIPVAWLGTSPSKLQAQAPGLHMAWYMLVVACAGGLTLWTFA